MSDPDTNLDTFNFTGGRPKRIDLAPSIVFAVVVRVSATRS